MTATEPITHYLARRASEVNEWLDTLVPSETKPPEQLHRAMRYSLLGGGKRLRPILVLATGEAVAGYTDLNLMPAACAIEMIHTYSLIHDDLPAMDNDDIRRGRPTCHKAFGEAVAILAGDALLTQAFRILALMTMRDTERQLQVIQEVAISAGTIKALIGGQMADIENEGKKVDAATLEYIHRSKTGAMISASVAVGAIIGGASDEQVDELRRYGECIGLAFQIADDILDVTSTSEQLGKTPGKDQAANKATYPAIHGIAASESRARELVDEAVAIVSPLQLQTQVLEDIAGFIIARTS
jgi:geranylgeranyl diphosphate synthase type II